MDRDSFSIGIQWKYKGKGGEYRVYPRYKNLKEEMSNYTHLPFDEIKEIMLKTKRYSRTFLAKSIKKYGYADPLKINHLICIIMYCDYGPLSRDFTISFRKSHEFQCLSQINKHNSGYYHWSKLLKETIGGYGQSCTARNGVLNKLIGPFFCGMSVVLNIPQFSMFIHSPLSTSIHIEVATKVCLYYKLNLQECMKWM